MLGRAVVMYWPLSRIRRHQVTGDDGETTIRVRYAETDRMGLLHHANYLVYFEQARTELLRQHGLSYKDLEDQGFLSGHRAMSK